jgi:hypothetical protein
MDQVSEGKVRKKARILVAPLDWGLGHATRCIPLIRELMRQGADVWLAGKGAQETLLKAEFPGLPFLFLPGYDIRYARTRSGLIKNLFFQIPGILRIIKVENKWLKNKIAEHGFNAVISDNRYGLYHPTVRCVFITHQLQIKTPFGRLAARWLQKRNYRYINRFASCWVPDEDNHNDLSGELSHPFKRPEVPLHYAGIFSRFRKLDLPERKDHLLFMISGPEPQRSLLEEKIIREIAHYHGTATIVRGLPGAHSLVPSTNMIRFYNHLPAEELNKEVASANWVIGRCGYSTIMDLAFMKKKSILIPTPGQTEQEYLGKYLHEKKIIYNVSQDEFSIQKSLQAAKDWPYNFQEYNQDLLKVTVEQLLDKL